MAELIMMIGLPGSGKSTWIKYHHLNHFDYVVISIDDLIEEMGKEEGLNYSDAYDKFQRIATKQMRANLKEALKDRKNIIWDQTNVKESARRKKLKGIPDDYTLTAVAFDIDKDELKRRRDKREIEDGKLVPYYTLKQMEGWYKLPTKSEGFEKIQIIKS